MAQLRRRYRVFGDVQAVGFRYTARMVAGRYDLTGYVQNEYDGSVTAEVQGDPDAVHSFLTNVEAASRWIRIDPYLTSEKDLPIDDEERSFEIRGY